MSTYYETGEFGGEPTPPFGEDVGSCGLGDIESVKNVDENIIGQCAEPIVSTAFLSRSGVNLPRPRKNLSTVAFPHGSRLPALICPG
jgi:hypothetical protein